jgi:hypothetical protein
MTVPVLAYPNPLPDSENACIDPEQPPVPTPIDGTADLENRLAGNNEYFNIFDDEINQWSLFSCKEEYQSAQ